MSRLRFGDGIVLDWRGILENWADYREMLHACQLITIVIAVSALLRHNYDGGFIVG